MVSACRGQPGRRPGGSAAEAGSARLPAARRPGGGGRPAARTRSGPSPRRRPAKAPGTGAQPGRPAGGHGGPRPPPPAEPEGLRPSSAQTRKPTYLSSRARARIRARTAHARTPAHISFATSLRKCSTRTAHARTPAHRRGKPRRFFHYSTGLALCNGDCKKSCKLFVNPIDNAEKVSTIIIVSTRSE